MSSWRSENRVVVEWDRANDTLDIRDPYLLFFLRRGEWKQWLHRCANWRNAHLAEGAADCWGLVTSHRTGAPLATGREITGRFQGSAVVGPCNMCRPDRFNRLKDRCSPVSTGAVDPNRYQLGADSTPEC
jgi:hypothetical protein